MFLYTLDGCEFKPCHRTLFFDHIYIFSFIYLYNSLNIIHNYFQIIFVAEYRLNDSKQFIPIELTHPMASRIYVFMFANVPLDTFYKFKTVVQT